MHLYNIRALPFALSLILCLLTLCPAIDGHAAARSATVTAPPGAPYSTRQLSYVARFTSVQTAKVILTAAHRVARRYRLEPRLLIAMIEVESAFRPRVSRRGRYHGLMQIRSAHHRERARSLGVRDVFRVHDNILLGTDILVDYRAQAKGNLRRALVRYSGGSYAFARSVMAKLNLIPR